MSVPRSGVIRSASWWCALCLAAVSCKDSGVSPGGEKGGAFGVTISVLSATPAGRAGVSAPGTWALYQNYPNPFN